MYIILEGAQSTGKSTLLNQIKQKYEHMHQQEQQQHENEHEHKNKHKSVDKFN